MLYKQEKNQSVETDSEITEIMELLDNNIKTVTLNIFHTLKNFEKNIEWQGKNGDVKMTYMELLEMKNTIIEIKGQ